MIKIFWQPWADKIENCNGRIKALRSFFEQQLDLLDKLVNISWTMTEKSEKMEAFENRRQNLKPVFSEKFFERMTESVAVNEQKF